MSRISKRFFLSFSVAEVVLYICWLHIHLNKWTLTINIHRSSNSEADNSTLQDVYQRLVLNPLEFVHQFEFPQQNHGVCTKGSNDQLISIKLTSPVRLGATLFGPFLLNHNVDFEHLFTCFSNFRITKV